MKTLRNVAVAALLTLAAVVIDQQSAYAYDPSNACQGPNPAQQCAIVPGGYPYILPDEDECVWSSYAEGPVWRSHFVCRKEPDSEWGGGYCFQYFPSGNPQYCG